MVYCCDYILRHPSLKRKILSCRTPLLPVASCRSRWSLGCGIPAPERIGRLLARMPPRQASQSRLENISQSRDCGRRAGTFLFRHTPSFCLAVLKENQRKHRHPSWGPKPNSRVVICLSFASDIKTRVGLHRPCVRNHEAGRILQTNKLQREKKNKNKKNRRIKKEPCLLPPSVLASPGGKLIRVYIISRRTSQEREALPPLPPAIHFVCPPALDTHKYISTTLRKNSRKLGTPFQPVPASLSFPQIGATTFTAANAEFAGAVDAPSCDEALQLALG